jgi:glycosyltransferase involved in cell wall biosynthesis
MPELDIIVPTKDRYSTLIPTTHAILQALEDADYNIVIYDNSQGEIPTEEIEALKRHPKVKYTHHPENLDAVQNFNFAIDASTAEYCTLIGDDDFVLPTIFQAINELRRKKLDCLIQHRPTYYWPGVKFDREFDYFAPASLQIQRKNSDAITDLDPQKELDYVLDKGGIYLFNLPALYHGLVSRTSLQKIKKKYKNYIFGPSPDISLAYMLAISINTYGYYHTAFSIAGASFNSAAGMGRRGEHSASLDSAPAWLPKTMKDDWDPRLPATWNGFTVYAQSLYLSAKAAGTTADINYKAHYKKILRHNFNDIAYFNSREELKNKLTGPDKLKCFLIFHLREFMQRMPNWILNIVVRMRPAFRTLQFYRGVNGPAECIQLATRHITSNRIKAEAA